ncbi:hypothetical protein ES288_A11G384600v1 [Gossypium darwinii]|uniref:Uncharacterized protein n=1 Tax=Gossypium darwinii TaxID=34276 RepID=A0A5D2ETR7_GOSDA|nr:hypothetical protein ES288_A11G384600v1 [Gossypium darwinii]
MTNELPLIPDQLSVGRKQDRFPVSFFASVGQIVRLLCTLDVSSMLFEVVCRSTNLQKLSRSGDCSKNTRSLNNLIYRGQRYSMLKSES